MINERLTHEELELLFQAMKSHSVVLAESASEAEVIECSQIVRALRELQERRKADNKPVYQCEFCHADASGEIEWHWEDVNKAFYEQYDSERRGQRRILYSAPQLAPEMAAIVERLNLSGYEYESGEVTPQNAAAVVDILLQQLDDAVQGRNAQPAPAVDSEFIPNNLDKALGVVGVALPESKEEFNFQTERWIQRLIDRVIRYADEFKEQPTPTSAEPEMLPLNYLQGHQDALEWASQLAKANHPETGDWLYDDPIELAKAIRKGPDMPPEPKMNM
ncbi:hypothetical protein LQE22_004287 [Klebsiella oxytoca]